MRIGTTASVIGTLSSILVGCGSGGGAPGAVGATCGAGGSARFAITDLGANVLPTGINADGTIVANALDASGSQHAVVIRGGQVTTLGTLGGSFATVTAINASGQIAGASIGADGVEHAALWPAGQTSPVDLGLLPGDANSIAWAINDAGILVGGSSPMGGGSSFVFWKPGATTPTRVLGLAGSTTDDALSINAAGHAVGGSTLPATGTSMGLAPIEYFEVDLSGASPSPAMDLGIATFLGGTGGATPLEAFINAAGAIAFSAGFTVKVREPDGKVQSISPANTSAVAAGFDDAGDVLLTTGTVEVPGAQTNAELFQPSSGVLDLTAQTMSSCGWQLANAAGINARGEIVGSGTLNGQPHGFLLTPNH